MARPPIPREEPSDDWDPVSTQSAPLLEGSAAFAGGSPAAAVSLDSAPHHTLSAAQASQEAAGPPEVAAAAFAGASPAAAASSPAVEPSPVRFDGPDGRPQADDERAMGSLSTGPTTAQWSVAAAVAHVSRVTSAPAAPTVAQAAAGPPLDAVSPSMPANPPVVAPTPALSGTPFASGSMKRTMVGMAPHANTVRRAADIQAGFEPDFRSKKTIMGMPSLTPATPQRGDEPARAAPAAGQRTIIGVPVPTPAPANDEQEKMTAKDEGAAARNLSSRPPAHQRTAMGLAVPGVAPLAPGVIKAEGGHLLAPARGGIVQSAGALREAAAMSPSARARAHAPPPVAPAPTGRARATTSRSAAAAVIGGLLLALGAALFALLWRSPPPLRAEARVDANGSDLLHITCSTCPDGTELRSGGALAKVSRESADLQLAAPLRVGDNPFDVDIDRPGSGRDEHVGLLIKIGYRIRPDLSLMDSDHPALRVAIDGSSGAVVTVDGKAVVLGPDGKGLYDVDVTRDCTGLSDEPKVIDRAITYAVTSGSGAVENGTINLHVAVPPLHVDSPAEHAYFESEWFMLAGRTAKGARLTAGSQVVGVAADGTFSRSMQAARLGVTSVALRAYAPGQASRVATLEIERVEHLRTVAPAFAANAPLTFSDLAASIATHAGEPIVLMGEVMEGRTQGSKGLVVLDVQKGCARSPCLARVVLPGQDAPGRGEHIQVYGRVRGAVPSAATGASPVPEVEAAFVLKGP